ncbi:MAG: hypothetical protein V4484_14320 [Pseudomonadota bacterium]
MATPFAAHGEFKAHVEGRIIVSEVVGPWNKELVDKWSRVMYGYAKQLSASGPHVGIARIHTSMMCPPDALQAMRQAVLFGNERLGSIGNALVADPGVEGRALMLPMYEQLYLGGNPYAFFHDLDSATAWALALLAAKGF